VILLTAAYLLPVPWTNDPHDDARNEPGEQAEEVSKHRHQGVGKCHHAADQPPQNRRAFTG